MVHRRERHFDGWLRKMTTDRIKHRLTWLYIVETEEEKKKDNLRRLNDSTETVL